MKFFSNDSNIPNSYIEKIFTSDNNNSELQVLNRFNNLEAISKKINSNKLKIQIIDLTEFVFLTTEAAIEKIDSIYTALNQASSESVTFILNEANLNLDEQGFEEYVNKIKEMTSKKLIIGIVKLNDFVTAIYGANFSETVNITACYDNERSPVAAKANGAPNKAPPSIPQQQFLDGSETSNIAGAYAEAGLGANADIMQHFSDSDADSDDDNQKFAGNSSSSPETPPIGRMFGHPLAVKVNNGDKAEDIFEEETAEFSPPPKRKFQSLPTTRVKSITEQALVETSYVKPPKKAPVINRNEQLDDYALSIKIRIDVLLQNFSNYKDELKNEISSCLSFFFRNRKTIKLNFLNDMKTEVKKAKNGNFETKLRSIIALSDQIKTIQNDPNNTTVYETATKGTSSRLAAMLKTLAEITNEISTKQRFDILSINLDTLITDLKFYKNILDDEIIKESNKWVPNNAKNDLKEKKSDFVGQLLEKLNSSNPNVLEKIKDTADFFADYCQKNPGKYAIITQGISSRCKELLEDMQMLARDAEEVKTLMQINPIEDNNLLESLASKSPILAV